jgi:hypothetical protein
MMEMCGGGNQDDGEHRAQRAYEQSVDVPPEAGTGQREHASPYVRPEATLIVAGWP